MTSRAAQRPPSTARCFVACAPGLEKILVNELTQLGAGSIKSRRAGADCDLTLKKIYSICLWSRVANRLLYPLGGFQISDEKTYYQAVQRIDWSEHLTKDSTLAVDFFCSDSCITHSRYGAQLTKDSIVDWFRERFGERPSVDREKPDIRVNVYLYRNKARVSLDMSGSSLHRRNYRLAGTAAPLKENLAAAILKACRWSVGSGSLFDPMCGSGTLLIEGAMIAGNIAPGLRRDYFGFSGWLQHDAELWQSVKQEAKVSRREADIPKIFGSDIDASAVAVARKNIEAAGLSEYIDVEVNDFFTLQKPLPGGPGLVVVNPPYGERLQNDEQIGPFYSSLGRTLKRCASNWQLGLFTGAPALFHRTGFARRVILDCKNGDIDCRLFEATIPVYASSRQTVSEPIADTADTAHAAHHKADPWAQAMEQRTPPAQSQHAPGIDQFSDRLRKNSRQIRGWAKSAGITNYRLYDADLPDYAFAIDVYQDPLQQQGPYVCMQEYRAPRHIDAGLAAWRLNSAVDIVKNQLACVDEHLAVKSRDRQRGEKQYNRLERLQQYYQVAEGDTRLLINIHDYLDCGLFLDHRKVRNWLAGACTGKRFLNLYCYTATASVHAAVGGASESFSVDLSHKYLEWAEKNFEINNLDTKHHKLVRADCREWVAEYASSSEGQGFDVIFLDPPTFSNSSATEHDWDVQRDHLSMIEQCMSILKADGILVFSNNFRRFKLADAVPGKFNVQDRSRWSLQRDFSRSPKIHQCWFITHKNADGSSAHQN